MSVTRIPSPYRHGLAMLSMVVVGAIVEFDFMIITALTIALLFVTYDCYHAGYEAALEHENRHD